MMAQKGRGYKGRKQRLQNIHKVKKEAGCGCRTIIIIGNCDAKIPVIEKFQKNEKIFEK